MNRTSAQYLRIMPSVKNTANTAHPVDYLKHSIEQAKEFDNLTDDERLDPLFISGALHKDDKGKLSFKNRTVPGIHEQKAHA